MPFAAALSQHPAAPEATGEVAGHVLERLGREPDLAVLFCSTDHRDAMAEIAETVRQIVAPGVLLGAMAETVVGGDREIEDGPALSLWAARLPSGPRGARITAVRTETGTAVQGLNLRELEPGATVLLLADPFSLPVFPILDVLSAYAEGAPERAAGLQRVAPDFGGVRVVGGLASGSLTPGGNRLILDGEVFTTGAVGAVLAPDAGVNTVVSQGCRPVGEPMIVTKSQENVILELAGRPALDRIEELAHQADPEEATLLVSGLHMGIAIDEHRETFGRGDFLVRNVLGVDRVMRSIVIGQAAPVGTTVQFQVRDAAAADEDLRELLAPAEGDGALLFTCNGRGTRLFGAAHHDATCVRDAIGTDAVAGMACTGELGPVSGRSFVHGFSASVVLFQGS